ncbi:hypothetical protein EDC01DRAFT_664120 [Geopyxis carbonaria]|nr:hypothetical protein EDC01DRAFT_664120 [Geopyxis carbonaria]
MQFASLLLCVALAMSSYAVEATAVNPLFPDGTDVSEFKNNLSTAWKEVPFVGDESLLTKESNARRAAHGVYICIDFNFEAAGGCSYIADAAGHSYILTVGDAWNDKISSFGPDHGVTCRVWEHHSFTGKTAEIAYPGYGNLNDIGMQDMISAFSCWYQ